MKAAIRAKLYPKMDEAAVAKPSIVEAFSATIAILMEQPESFFDVPQEDGTRGSKSSVIGFLVIERDRIIREQATLQGRPTRREVKGNV